MMRLLFATHNRHKLEEAKAILGKAGMEIDHLEIEYDEPRSEDTSEIAERSARGLFSEVGKPLFLDDSGLFVDELKGFPGPYSAWVFRKMGYHGILELLRGKQNRKAYFKSSIAYADKEGVFVFDGIVHGTVTEEPRGDNGFGYDPILVPDGSTKTFAEMDDVEKNSMSHRKMAMQKFADWILKNRT